jgi:hypothetical protein
MYNMLYLAQATVALPSKVAQDTLVHWTKKKIFIKATDERKRRKQLRANIRKTTKLESSDQYGKK